MAGIASAPLFLLSLLSQVRPVAPAPAPAPPVPPTGSAPPAIAAGAVPAAAPATPPRASGFALELGTSGLAGTLGGALAFGWGSRPFAVGIAFDVVHSSLSSQAGDGTHMRSTTMAAGPWMRVALGHALDGRVDVAAALDLQYRRQSATIKRDTDPQQHVGDASGIVFRVGPGVRFWATPWLALAYTAQLSLTSLSGPLTAFTPSSTLGLSTSSFDNTEVALVGRFTALAIF